MKQTKLYVNEKVGSLPAVILSKYKTPVDVFDLIYSVRRLYYCQNRLVQKTSVFEIDPESGTDTLVSRNIEVLVEYCIIPEADNILQL